MLLDLLLQNPDILLLVGALLGLSVLLYYTVLLPFFFSPLCNIPGPKLAAITKYYILYKTWNEQRNRLVHELHAKYGPIVRIAPAEISISDPAYVKEIYSANFDKSQFYGQFSNYGRINAFSTLEKQGHIQRRRVTAQMYSKSYVTSEPIESIASTRVGDAITNIRNSLQKSKTVEVYELFHALAMDVVTGLILGDDQGTRMLQDQSRNTWKIIDDYRKQSSMWFWTTLMPEFYDWAAGKVRLEAGARAQAWNIVNCESAVEKGPSHGSILKKLYDTGVTGLDAFSEIQDHVAAGHETTGATLSFLTWHLSKHPEIQKELYDEIVHAFGPCPDKDYIPPYKQVEKLAYLNGVVMETFRLYAAIPGAEPRVVPPSGMMWRGSDSTSGESIYIPGGTIISMQPWTLHRDENVFKNALEFDPYRWINASEEELRVMNRSFMAFGAGVRMCLGLHLATEEIKLIVTSMYWRWKTTVHDGYSDDNMYVVDKYTVHPKSHFTLLDFEER